MAPVQSLWLVAVAVAVASLAAPVAAAPPIIVWHGLGDFWCAESSRTNLPSALH